MLKDDSEINQSASDAHMMAVMGNDDRVKKGSRKTGRPQGSQKKKEKEIDRLAKLDGDLDSAVTLADESE